MSGAIGIDLGSKNSVIAVVKSGGIEVIMNDFSSRATPSVVGFTPKQRTSGEAGFSKLSTNFRNTVMYPTRFLGFDTRRQNLDEERKWTTHTINEENNHITHQVHSGGEQHTFSTEQVTAMLITHLMEVVEKNKIKATDCVVSVPNYFNELERISLLNAISISGIPCVKIMNEGTAVALSYGLFRNDRFTEVPKSVAFVDLGHSKFSITIANFTKDKLEVLTHWSDRHLGGRDFDWVLMEHFAQDFKKKHNVDVLKNPRSRMKLAVAVEKLRKTLSANSDSHFSVEYLIEDLDLNALITREQFEAMSTGLLGRIEDNCRIALARAGIESVSSVEIIGGGSRIPMVQRAYAKAFKVEQVEKTLNQEEAVSRGCAVQAAMLSPLYRVKDFSVKDMVYYPLKFHYTNPSMDIDATPEILFDAKNTFPVTKIINTIKNGPFGVKVINEEQQLANFFSVNAPEEPAEYKIKIHIKMDKNGVLSLEKVEKVERIEEEVKPEEKKEEAKSENNAEGKPENMDEDKAKGKEEEKKEEEKKTKAKLRRTPIAFVGDQRGLNEQTIKDAIEKEKKFMASDNLARETLEKKNELESFIYDTRSHLGSYLAEYSTPETVNKLLESMKVIEEWLYDDGSDSTKDQYVLRLNNLRNELKPIQARYVSYSEIPNVLKSLEDAIKYSHEMFANTDERYSHILESDRQVILNKANEMNEILREVKVSLDGKKKYEDSGVNTDDIVKKALSLREVTNQIMNKPKPAPKVEEKKDEEKKTEDKSEDKPAGEEKKSATTEGGEQKMDIDP